MATRSNKKQQAFRTCFASSQGREVIQALLLHAQDEKETAVRCGRMDMIAYIFREMGKTIEEITSE